MEAVEYVDNLTLRVSVAALLYCGQRDIQALGGCTYVTVSHNLDPIKPH